MTGIRWTAGTLAIVVSVVATPGAVAQEPEVTLQVTTVGDTLASAVGGVAVDRLGYVYVADFGEKVWKISPYGEVTTVSESQYGASGNAVDEQGNLFQANFFGNTISRITRDGTSTVYATGLNGPVGIAIGDGGELYVCNCSANTIARVALDGGVTEFASGDAFNCPNGITRDSDGNLYVANFSDGRVNRVSPEGTIEEIAVVPGGGNGHVAYVSGQLYVTGFRSNRVYRVGMDGDITPVAGTGAFGAVDGVGPEATFATPNGLAYDPSRDALYLNDYLIPFRQRGQVQPLSVVRKLQFPTLTQSFNTAYETGGIDAALRAYDAYRQRRQGTFTELQFNAIGYALLGAGNVADAIRVFERNVEDYPNSFNVYDSLGEAVRASGDQERAIELYERSLELNPANTNAVQMLEEMGAR